jgi:hypothetical protein
MKERLALEPVISATGATLPKFRASLGQLIKANSGCGTPGFRSLETESVSIFADPCEDA